MDLIVLIYCDMFSFCVILFEVGHSLVHIDFDNYNNAFNTEFFYNVHLFTSIKLCHCPASISINITFNNIKQYNID